MKTKNNILKPLSSLVLSALVFYALCLWSSPARAHSSYYNSVVVTQYGSPIEIDTCGTCHGDWAGRDTRNNFGVHYYLFTGGGGSVPGALQAIDSDGDGSTNDAEMSAGTATFPGYPDKDGDGYISISYRGDSNGMPLHFHNSAGANDPSSAPAGYDLDDNNATGGNIAWLVEPPLSYPADTTLPEQVTDFRSGTLASGQLNLQWTAPGDDGATGTAHSYDIRYTTESIAGGKGYDVRDRSDWTTMWDVADCDVDQSSGEYRGGIASSCSAGWNVGIATPLMRVINEAAPSVAGSTDSQGISSFGSAKTTNVISDGTTYWVAMRSWDGVMVPATFEGEEEFVNQENLSNVSNVMAFTAGASGSGMQTLGTTSAMNDSDATGIVITGVGLDNIDDVQLTDSTGAVVSNAANSVITTPGASSITVTLGILGITPGAYTLELTSGGVVKAAWVDAFAVDDVYPVGGYTAFHVIPAAQISQSTDGLGIITINWKGKDDLTANVTLKTFEYSVNGGSSWSAPTNGDTSGSLSANWDDNGGGGWTSATTFAAATPHSFTFDTQHADTTGTAGIDQSDVQVRFKLNDGTYDSAAYATSESFQVDNLKPSSTITSAIYNSGTDTMTISGTNFTTIAVADMDIKSYVDWNKFVWDINGDNAPPADISFVVGDVTSLTVTDSTTLTLLFTTAKGLAIEATSGFGSSGGADTLDVTAGFSIDYNGNAATTDAIADGVLDTGLNWTGLGGDTDFNTAGNWSPAQTPTSSDNCVITSTSGAQPTISFNATCGSLTLGTGGTVMTLTFSSTNNLILSDDIIIGANGRITASGTPSGTFSIGGNWSDDIGTANFTNPASLQLTFSFNGAVKTISGDEDFWDIDINGSYTMTSDLRSANNFMISNAATLTHGSNTLFLDGIGFTNSGSYKQTCASIIEINGSVTIASGKHYPNVYVNNGGTLNGSNASFIDCDFTLDNGGSLTQGTGQMEFRGHWIRNTGSTYTPGGTAKVIMTGANKSIAGTIALNTFSALTIGDTAGDSITAKTDIQVDDILKVAADSTFTVQDGKDITTDLNVNIYGTMNVSGTTTWYKGTGLNKSIHVYSGGFLSAQGTDTGNRITLTRIGASNFIELIVDGGIDFDYVDMQYFKGSSTSGGLSINTPNGQTLDFDNVKISNSIDANNTVMMYYGSPQTVTADGIDFYKTTHTVGNDVNVKATDGEITFINYGGDFAGEDKDSDSGGIASWGSPDVTAAVAEITPTEVVAGSAGNSFTYLILPTISASNNGVNEVTITAPGGYTNLAVTSVTYSATDDSYDASTPVACAVTPGNDEYCVSITGQVITITLGAQIVNARTDKHIEIVFTADAPATAGSGAFTSTVDDAITADRVPFTTTAGDAGQSGTLVDDTQTVTVEGNAVTSAVAEISPTAIVVSSTGNSMVYDILPTIGAGDSGVDEIKITAPAGYSSMSVTAVSVGGSGQSLGGSCPTVGAGEYCVDITGQVITVTLGTKVTTSLTNIKITFDADAPGSTGSADFTSTVNDTSTTLVAAQATTAGNADGDSSDDDSYTVVVDNTAITSAVSEITPNSVDINVVGQSFTHDILPTIGGSDTGVDQIIIMVPSGYTALNLTSVTVGGTGQTLGGSCPAVGAGEYCWTTSGLSVTITLGTKVTTSLTNINLVGTADTPTSSGSGDFTSTLDDTGTALAGQATTAGNADADAGDNNSQTVTVTSSTANWEGDVSTAMSDGANWSTAVEPDNATDCVISSFVTYQPEVDVNTLDCGTLTLGTGGTAMTITFNANKDIRVSGDVTIGANGFLASSGSSAAVLTVGGNWSDDIGTTNISDLVNLKLIYDFVGTDKTIDTDEIFYHPRITGTITNNDDIKARSAFTLEAGGTLTMAANTDIYLQSNTYTLDGTWNNDCTNTFYIDGLNQSTATYPSKVGLLTGSTYPNLTVINNGYISSANSAIVSCDFTISTDNVFVPGNNNFYIGGDWVNNGGTFTLGASTINMIGANSVIRGATSPQAFNNLTIGDGAGDSTTALVDVGDLSGVFTVNSGAAFAMQAGNTLTTTVTNPVIAGSIYLSGTSTWTVGNAISLTIDSGALLSAQGTDDTNRVTITGDTASSFWHLIVNGSADLNYVDLNYMDNVAGGAAGFRVYTPLAQTFNFNNVKLYESEDVNGATMMQYNSTKSVTAVGIDFQTSSYTDVDGDINVEATAGSIDFVGFGGTYGGETRDFDNGGVASWYDGYAGVVYSDHGVTPVGAGVTVRAIVNGVDQGTATTDAGGNYAIGIAQAANDNVLVYIDNHGSYNASTVTQSDGSFSGSLDLYDGHIIVRNDNAAGNMTNTLMDTALGAWSDSDIHYSVTGTALTAAGSSAELYVPAGHSYVPGGNVTSDGLKTDGTFDGGSNLIDINGELNIEAGSFTASSGNIKIAGNFTYTGGTFTHNGGTIFFDGTADQTFTTGAQVFNDIYIENTGTDPNDDLVVSGALDINGTLDIVNGDLDIATNNVVVTTAGNVTIDVAGNIFNIGHTAGWTFDGTTIYSDSSVTSPLDVHDITVNGTSLTLNSDMRIDSVNVAAGTLDLGIGGHTLHIHESSGTPITVSGTFTAGDSTVMFSGTSAATNITALPYNNLLLSPDNAVTYTLAGNLTGANEMTGNLTIGANATLDVSGSNYDIGLAGNWNNSGTFTPQSGTVTFTGTGQSINGSTNFYNLTKSVASVDTLTIQGGTTQTIGDGVGGNVTLNGAVGNLLSLRSSSSPTQWNFNVAVNATKSISYVDVKDSDASGSDGTHKPINPANSTDSGNNLDWFSLPLVKVVYRGDTCVASSDGDAACNGGVTTTPALTGEDITFVIYISNPGASVYSDARFQDDIDDAGPDYFEFQGDTYAAGQGIKWASTGSGSSTKAAIKAALNGGTALTNAFDGSGGVNEYCGIDTGVSPDVLKCGGDASSPDNDQIDIGADDTFAVMFNAVKRD